MTNPISENRTDRHSRWTTLSLLALSVLRIVIGWHFLYEGLIKLGNPSWTSAGYLLNAQWLGADTFQAIANNPAALKVVDLINIWGLVLIGLALMLGVLSRFTSFCGVALLFLYYAANPPLADAARSVGAEGNYLLIDKNLVELFSLVVLTFIPTGRFLGLDGFIRTLRTRRAAGPGGRPVSTGAAGFSEGRRNLLRHLATIPAFGGFVYAYQKRHGWGSFEVNNLIARKADPEADATSGATIKRFDFATLDQLKGKIPMAKIGDIELSRMFLGGNLMGGWAHARDLIYVSKLVKAYHSDHKIFETFHLAEQCGMNTILTNPILSRVINDYWEKEGGKIQFFSDCALKGDVMAGIQMSIDGGAHSCYVQGGIADNCVKKGDLDTIANALELIRKNGLPAGIGAHRLDTVKACVERGLKPDYWMKTLHRTDYWSAQIETQHDNIWSESPEETAAYMEHLEEPWIAFKILAAGAIHPKVGFKYAFQNGADFICVGMYDFQVVDNANLALDVLDNVGARNRPWRA